MPPFGWNHMRSCNNKTSFVFQEANSDTENKSDPRYSQLEASSKEPLENSHPPDQKAPVGNLRLFSLSTFPVPQASLQPSTIPTEHSVMVSSSLNAFLFLLAQM